VAIAIDGSTARAIRSIISTAWNRIVPVAVSAESMTADVPSSTAFATSLASARVGSACSIIDSSICVAVITGLPASETAQDDPFLQQWDCRGADLDPEVAARHHHGVGLQ